GHCTVDDLNSSLYYATPILLTKDFGQRIINLISPDISLILLSLQSPDDLAFKLRFAQDINFNDKR
ncbi:MAG: hypothetical protein RMY64_22525, partial [Nostoc sp. DedQUE08]|uniref:hypothetical protein n=1 Tax=Nostoc sp. DedQUE08 TaxID=3075393 RepID=UPI002AD31172